MHNPESILDNEMLTLLWDFEIQTNHLIMANRPPPCDNQQKEENLPNYRLGCPGSPQSKTERK